MGEPGEIRFSDLTHPLPPEQLNTEANILRLGRHAFEGAGGGNRAARHCGTIHHRGGLACDAALAGDIHDFNVMKNYPRPVGPNAQPRFVKEGPMFA